MIPPNLFAWQIQHYERLIRNLKKYSYAIDGSPPGTGKTHIASAIAVAHNLPVMIIGPNSARQTWLDAVKNYELETEPFDFINYESFRVSPNASRKSKHDLFIKGDEGDLMPSEKLNELLRKRRLIIFDEAQALKNRNTSNFATSRVLIRAAVNAGSWVMLLSGSLIDSKDQVINFLYLLGILNNPWLYTNYFGRIDYNEWYNLIEWIFKTDSATRFKESKFINQFIPKKVKEYAFDVFVEYIKPELVSIMPVRIEDDLTASIDVKNGFYHLGKRERILYEEALTSTMKELFRNVETGGGLNITNITYHLVNIQRFKVKSLIRVALNDLETKDKNYKIIIYSNYNIVIDELMYGLRDYDPICLTGKVSVEKREVLTSQFLENNNKRRVMISNTLLGSKSLNLQDKTGLFPRRMYIMPSYFINDQHQAVFRTYRVGTVGVAYIRFFYGLTEMDETEAKLLDVISRRGKVMSGILKEQNVIFPNDYEAEYEGKLNDEDDDELLERLRLLAMD